MKKLLKRCIACLALLCVMTTVQAAVYPKYPVQKLTDGQTYTVACGGMRATTRVRTQK